MPDTSGVIIFRVYFSRRLIIQSARGTRSNDWADEREAGTLDAQQPRTNKAEAAALHEGGDARGDEGHGYEIARCFSIKFQCARDDERRCDDGHEDGQ